MLYNNSCWFLIFDYIWDNALLSLTFSAIFHLLTFPKWIIVFFKPEQSDLNLELPPVFYWTFFCTAFTVLIPLARVQIFCFDYCFTSCLSNGMLLSDLLAVQISVNSIKIKIRFFICWLHSFLFPFHPIFLLLHNSKIKLCLRKSLWGNIKKGN